MTKTQDKKWLKTTPEIFWAEVAPCDHILQIYENDESIVAALSQFIISGFETNESVVIVATYEHLVTLDALLLIKGYNLQELKNKSRYLTFEANDLLSKFMVDGWPDEGLFFKAVTEIIKKVKNNNKVRVYGEMVAILWAQGHSGATVRLEHLWTKLCRQEEFMLFCAYPKIGFTQDITTSINHICSAHNKMISGEVNVDAGVLQYKNL
ncbi:MAG TPA: MEDS domain-containing protein [Bacteroidia bacterium]|nr:MEDS domain-containing protein [Bacteroidia bacterium]